MTEMAPEAPLPVPIEIRAEVELVSHLTITVDGPAGLKATVHIPNEDEAFDQLDTFVGSLPQAVQAAIEAAEEQEDARA